MHYNTSFILDFMVLILIINRSEIIHYIPSVKLDFMVFILIMNRYELCIISLVLY